MPEKNSRFAGASRRLERSSKNLAIATLVLALAGTVPALAQNQIPPAGAAQIQALLQDKGTWTAAQQKLDSQIIYNAKVATGQAVGGGLIPSFMPGILEMSNGLIHVDIQGNVNQALLNAIAGVGGRVEASYPQYNAIRAWLPLAGAETVASRTDVRLIRPADQAVTSSGVLSAGRPTRNARAANLRAQLSRALPALATEKAIRAAAAGVTGTGPDTNGVKAHGADIVQALGIMGGGVKIGVLSDGVTTLAAEQAAGRLPATVTVLPGQGNQGPGPCPGSNCPDEGTAMLEIVYSMAPNAQLYFATAFVGGQAGFAANIMALRAAGCDIIVDDVTYFAEPVFQDGTVAQAVNSVTASGALYFSDAQNSGNKDSNQSGTWEGDFADGGLVTTPENGHIHNFGGATFDTLTATSQFGVYGLHWSDPVGGSCNDYDLFILDPTGTSVLAASTTTQNCTQNPIELIGGVFPAGSRIVIVNFANAQTRALHLDTERGRLSIGTAGATFSHNAAAAALTVAATNVANAGGGIFLGNGQDPPETFSSDGPRKIFYDPAGNPITPNNFTFASGGGTTLNKVDFTAADGVMTGVGGFNPFFGTSAAAPHAAAIAALLKSANPALSNAQIISAMKATALAVTAPAGVGARTVGSGIVMANLALNAVLPDLKIAKSHVGNFTQGQTGASYSITVTNSGAGPTSGLVSVVDTLPAGLTPTAMAGTGWACVLGTLTCTRSDSLAGGSAYPAITLTVNVALNAPASVTNSASVTNPNITPDADDTANDPTTVNPFVVPADLAITKSHAGNFTQGQVGASYTIGVLNLGGTPTTGTVTVVDILPAGLTPAAISGTGWACVLGTLTCTRSDSLAGGASYPAITLTVNVAPNAPATVTNSANVTNPNIPPDADDTANDPTTINAGLPDLKITKSHPADFVQGQSAATYTLTVRNTGVAPTSGLTTVVDLLPAGLTPTAMSGSGWTCVLATLTCTRADPLAPGAFYPDITLTVDVAANAPPIVTNSANVTNPNIAADADDTANDPTNILPPTDLLFFLWFFSS